MNRILIFDFFGVICSEVAPFWIRDFLPEEDAENIHQTFIRDVDAGKSSSSSLFDTLGKMRGVSAKDVEDEWKQYIKLNNILIEYIRDLKKEYRIALCSNAWSDFINPILKENNLIELFETIVISSEVGFVKPNKEIYIDVLKKLEADPKDCLFIDDNPNNVRGAELIGMNGCLYKNMEDFKSILLK